MNFIFLLLILITTDLYATDWFVIVDAVAGGNFIGSYIREKAKELKRDVKLVHIKSRPVYPEVFQPTFRPEDFDEQYVLNESGSNLMEIINAVKRHGNIFPALAGAETGVLLADHFNTRAELPGNRLDLSDLKRNKDLLYKFLFDKGLITAPSASITTVDEGLQWMKKSGVPFPIIAKPVDDAGGHGFETINSLEEFEISIKKILSQKTFEGKKISRIVLQPKLVGEEFAVNGAMRDGKIVFTDIIQYEKEGAVYLRDTLLDPKNLKVRPLIEYVSKTLAAMGMRIGAFHFEVIDSDRYGIVLIDAGGRPMGGKDYIMVRACTGKNQVMAMVDAFLDPEDFDRRANRLKEGKNLYEFKPGTIMDLVGYEEGIATSIEGLETIKGLKTVTQVITPVKTGYEIPKTVDVFTTLGFVILIGEDAGIESDYKTIKAMEKRNLIFNIQPQKNLCGRILRGPASIAEWFRKKMSVYK